MKCMTSLQTLKPVMPQSLSTSSGQRLKAHQSNTSLLGWITAYFTAFTFHFHFWCIEIQACWRIFGLRGWIWGWGDWKQFSTEKANIWGWYLSRHASLPPLPLAWKRRETRHEGEEMRLHTLRMACWDLQEKRHMHDDTKGINIMVWYQSLYHGIGKILLCKGQPWEIKCNNFNLYSKSGETYIPDY